MFWPLFESGRIDRTRLRIFKRICDEPWLMGVIDNGAQLNALRRVGNDGKDWRGVDFLGCPVEVRR